MALRLSASAIDLDFHSARFPSPYLSAPSTPRRSGDYFITLSAPTSPTRISNLYCEFDHFPMSNQQVEKSGNPKSISIVVDDFAFDFSADLEKNSLSADELFDGGKIKPLKPPPSLQELSDGAKSPRKKNNFDPFVEDKFLWDAPTVENCCERGRQRKTKLLSSTSGERATRSLSPFRVSEEHENDQKPSSSATDSSSCSSKSGSGRWRLKDFLLFRSASEGRASDKDPLKKYSSLFKKQVDTKNSSFGSMDCSFSASGMKKKGKISAHELHYKANRAASQDMKKKTFLPYKQGILGR